MLLDTELQWQYNTMFVSVKPIVQTNKILSNFVSPEKGEQTPGLVSGTGPRTRNWNSVEEENMENEWMKVWFIAI